MLSLSLSFARSLWTLMWLWLETGLRDGFGGVGLGSHMYCKRKKGEVRKARERVCVQCVLKYESQKRQKEARENQIKVCPLTRSELAMQTHKHTLWPLPVALSLSLSLSRSLSLPSLSLSLSLLSLTLLSALLSSLSSRLSLSLSLSLLLSLPLSLSLSPLSLSSLNPLSLSLSLSLSLLLSSLTLSLLSLLSLSPPFSISLSLSLSTPLCVRRTEAVGSLQCVWEPRVLCGAVI